MPNASSTSATAARREIFRDGTARSYAIVATCYSDRMSGPGRSAAARFYEREVLSRLLDHGMRGVDPLRAELVVPLSGRVLEIGFGTGATLPFYSAAVTELVAVEPATELAAIAKAKLAVWGRRHELLVTSATRPLPIDAESFDAVVVAFVLCSVERGRELLTQAHRALRPGGSLVLAEHVLDTRPMRRRAQRAARPVWKAIVGGCDPAKDTGPLLREAGFDTGALEHRELALPWLVGSGLVGSAKKH